MKPGKFKIVQVYKTFSMCSQKGCIKNVTHLLSLPDGLHGYCTNHVEHRMQFLASTGKDPANYVLRIL